MEGSRHNRLEDIFDEPTDEESASPEGDGAARSGPIESLVDHLADARDEILRYLSARADQFKLSALNFALWLALVAVTGLAAITVVLAAVVLVVIGLAGMLSDLTGLPAWAGQLIVGLTIVVAAGGGLALVVYGIRQGSLYKTIEKYERRRS